MSYGKFSTSFDEYVVGTCDPIHPIDNYLWNEKVFSHVTHTGLGYLWYDHKGTEITRITTGGECESLYDKYYNRLVYIRDNETGEYWNLNWEPVLKPADDFSCTHGLGYTSLCSTVNQVRAELLLFVPPGRDPLEIWRVSLTNLSDARRDLSVFTYNEISFLCTGTYGEIIYQQGEFSDKLNAIVCTKRAETLPHDHFTCFLATNHDVAGFDCSKESFVGPYRMLNAPQAVERGRCFNRVATCEQPITVLQLDMSLQPGQGESADLLFGISSDVKDIERHIRKYFNDDGIAKAFEALAQRNLALKQKNIVESPDAKLNMLTNIWNKHQIEFGSYWSRWGLRGYRDVVQHTMALSLIHPQHARETLLTAMRYQYKAGRALRSWCPIDERLYTDSGLWLIFAVTKYIRETGDLDLLNVTVPFFDEGEDTVYEHLLAAVDFLWRMRDTRGMCLIKFGDWNDSLTQIGKEGKGESVWLTMGLARATLEMAQIASHIGDDRQARMFEERHDALKKAINDFAWEHDRYIRAFDDEGRPVGSATNREGKIYLNTQSWAILGRVAPDDRTRTIIKTVDTHLLTPLGYMLLTPSYKEYAPNIGRITNMQPGIAENGTVYAHGNAFMMLAYLQEKMADKAYDIYRRIAPAYMALPQEQTGAVPYAFPNCYFGPEHKTRPFLTEYSWITGSVAWFYLCVIEWMFGLRSDYDALVIDPCLPSEWDRCSAVRHFRGKLFHVDFERKDGVAAAKITLNGVPMAGNRIAIEDCHDMNHVTVSLPVANETTGAAVGDLHGAV